MSRVALVTGANAGIGYELVKLLSEKGVKVYLGARNPATGKEAAKTLASEGFSNVHFIEIDVTKPPTIEATRDHIAQADGKLDILVNNAGVGELDKPQLATGFDINVLRTTTEVNLFGLIQTTTTLLPLLQKSPNGVIVNVSSDMASNATQAGPNAILNFATAYNVSKAAANAYTIALANQLRDDGSKVKVNAVTPGYTSTKLNGFGEGGKSVKAGAEILLPWALLDKDGPSGRFINERGEEFPW
ncbi:oxidoreductase [Coprinopsis cinerea okayama7|uniref:Oxidoreductase n=1 Tax=Coprinopsis cinerea (strain Okayama-7 / 130 / ATCC MYA-4618 / FGSC 9003) TaxID=240176 RepID=D6RPB7_COPC7|nr:oxidoreductase [Coprinopsis cinerea okayama7\|eukprot:XP_002910647.1 oxidoreductase [Coprinopsis cinerea okayama7\